MSPRDQYTAIMLLRRWRKFCNRLGSVALDEHTTPEQIAAEGREYQALIEDTDEFLAHGAGASA